MTKAAEVRTATDQSRVSRRPQPFEVPTSPNQSGAPRRPNHSKNSVPFLPNQEDSAPPQTNKKSRAAPDQSGGLAVPNHSKSPLPKPIRRPPRRPNHSGPHFPQTDQRPRVAPNHSGKFRAVPEDSNRPNHKVLRHPTPAEDPAGE